MGGALSPPLFPAVSLRPLSSLLSVAPPEFPALCSPPPPPTHPITTPTGPASPSLVVTWPTATAQQTCWWRPLPPRWAGPWQLRGAQGTAAAAGSALQLAWRLLGLASAQSGLDLNATL